jgi:peptidoglycan/xylan/chitin deacetylase (PgdA/CDA1 family)
MAEVSSISEQGRGALEPGKSVWVTTSWDDGRREDLKLAELLAARGLPATFYVPSGSLGKNAAMSVKEIRELSNAGFEIGAHTVTHPILTQVSRSAARQEVEECKHHLEDVLGREVSSFAYPKGRYNAEVVALVGEAGYRCARGLRMLSLSRDFPPFEMPVTVQAYPHRWTSYARNLLRRGEVAALAKFSVQIGRSKNWVELGKNLFDRALREGGAWHLLGHSWETERLGGWHELEEMLDYVSQRPGVRYLTNGQLCESLHPGLRGKNPCAGSPVACA